MGNLVFFKLHQTHNLWNLIILKSCGSPKLIYLHSCLYSQTLCLPPGHLWVGSGRARLGGGSQAGEEGKQKPLFPPKEQTFLPHFLCSTCIFWVHLCMCVSCRPTMTRCWSCQSWLSMSWTRSLVPWSHWYPCMKVGGASELYLARQLDFRQHLTFKNFICIVAWIDFAYLIFFSVPRLLWALNALKCFIIVFPQTWWVASERPENLTGPQNMWATSWLTGWVFQSCFKSLHSAESINRKIWPEF